MARMMPNFFPTDAPPGEQAVFGALAESNETDDWFVLHSVGIADHVKNPEGEADFVVVAPELGILVIEVKSHQNILYDAEDSRGAWKLGSQPPKKRGPFQQALEANHSLRGYLSKKNVDLHSIPTLHAVWFTGVRARTMLPASPEWQSWQILDSEDLRRDPIAGIRRTFAGGIEHLRDKFSGFARGGVGPDAATAARVAAILRPRFEFGVVAGDARKMRESELIQFIDEQYSALDAMADNDAVLFTGPAGSGKTLLAIEAARRELAKGRTGRFICFNKLLGKHLAAATTPHRSLMTGTLHSQLLAIAGVDVPKDAGPDFWNNELPDLALEALANSPADAQDDFLIVDEVQDVLSEKYLDVLDMLVKGGLRSGRVLMFGDFERQSIYKGALGIELLRSRIRSFPIHRLVYNCRNLPRIGTAVNLFSGLEPGYKKFRRNDDGANPVWIEYRQDADQEELLCVAIAGLREDGYDLSEIVILSPLGDGSVAATTKHRWLRQVLRREDGSAPRKGELRYSSIHAYKGLEAPAVIVTDLDRRLVSNFESVMYVGLTRATDRLVGIAESGTGLAGVEGRL